MKEKTTEILRPDWRKWSLRKKIDYVKGSHGGFNLTRQDIAALPDESRGVHYEMKVIRMAVDVIDELTEKLRYARLDVESVPNNFDN